MWRDFNFLRLTDRQLTDGQNRLLNPASRMRAQGNEDYQQPDVRCASASLTGSFPPSLTWCGRWDALRF